MRLPLFIVFSAIMVTQLAHANELLGFNPETTCKSTLDAEVTNGAKLREPPFPPNPVMKDFFGTIEFTRFHQGTMATIIYLCQGTKVSGGTVVAQIIQILRASEDDARREYDRQKQLLIAQLGPPCWDPSTLDEQSREQSPSHGHSLTTWRNGAGLYTDIHWSPRTPPLDSLVVIDTYRYSTLDRSKQSALIGPYAPSCMKVE